MSKKAKLRGNRVGPIRNDFFVRALSKDAIFQLV